MALARPNLRFSTTLYQAADDSQTTLFLNAVPVTVPCYLIIDPRTDKEEVVKVTAKSTNSITVVRGQGGTSAIDHSVGAAAVDYNVPSYFTDLADAYENVFDDEGNPKEEGSLVTKDGEQELTNKTLTDPVLNGDLTGDAILDEDDMASDSDTKVPTQQSVKAYVHTKRVTTEASSGTPTPNADSQDVYALTALAAAAALGAPSGTPTNGQGLIVRIKDNGTARALTYNAIYRAVGVELPTTTVVGKTIYLGMIYNAQDTKWDVIAVAQEE